MKRLSWNEIEEEIKETDMGVLPPPLSNEALQAIRKKAQAAQSPSAEPPTAEQVAYDCGIKGLIPVIQRIEALERQVKELTAPQSQRPA
jgi:hypothetical protein